MNSAQEKINKYAEKILKMTSVKGQVSTQMTSNKIAEAVETWGTKPEPAKATKPNATKYVAGDNVLEMYETLKAKEQN